MRDLVENVTNTITGATVQNLVKTTANIGGDVAPAASGAIQGIGNLGRATTGTA